MPLHPGALHLLWSRGPYYFHLSSQANQSSCQNYSRSFNHSAYLRTYSKPGKRIVPEQSHSQEPAKSVSNLGYLAYYSERLDNECIFISCTLGNFKCNVLLDSGCSAYACIEDTFAQVFHQEPLPKPRTLRSYDGKILTTTHLVKIRMSLANGAHQKNIPMFVTPGLNYDVILGMPWLKKYQSKIEWDSESVTFNSETCQNHCLESNNGFPIIILSYQRPQKMSKPIPVQEPFQPLENHPIPIGAIAFQHLASKPDHKIYSVSLRDIEQALKPKAKTNPATVLPEHYKEFLKVFSHEEANKLPLHYPGVDHTIKMQPGTQPPAGPLYGMSRDEL